MNISEESKVKNFISSVNIALDNYEDIFSDFDTSPYKDRIMSDDFLKEVQKRYVENKYGNFELTFSLPKRRRNKKIETVIKKRLSEYFAKKAEETNANSKNEIRNAIFKIAFGSVLIAITVLAEYFEIESLLVQLIFVITVPAGWYLLYSSFETLLENKKNYADKVSYFLKMAKMQCEFIDEESIIKGLEEEPEKSKRANGKEMEFSIGSGIKIMRK